jgi:hypothetical protein
VRVRGFPVSGDEHAANPVSRTFPEEWGLPQGRPNSETRAAWVRQMVDRHSALTAHRKLAARAGRLLVALRVLDLRRREEGP